ncbi:MAG: hypothetical protein JWM80_3802 [Cyanobacteria bacterium RYN_339]|nr:hypothetical protein [Cyanobacteria bacterium RYN_339]
MDFQTPIALAMVASAAGTLVWRQAKALRPKKAAGGCKGCPSGGSCSKLSC